MSLNQITDALADYRGSDPAGYARLGFLEWASQLPQDAEISLEASAALGTMARSRSSQAWIIFAGLMTEAQQPLPKPVRRGGAAGRRMGLAA
jgi:hypothetical protein